MKLYLDDLRNPPEGWALARNIREAKRLVEANKGQITNMSLDHDLGICYCRMCAKNTKSCRSSRKIVYAFSNI